MITKLVKVTSDVSLKDNTLISPKLTHVITGITEVLHEDLLGKLPPTRDIQHIINLVLGANLPDLSHHKMKPTIHAELKGQVDELSLEIR